jgi:DNA-binding beta-propeller fold protein YncE
MNKLFALLILSFTVVTAQDMGTVVATGLNGPMGVLVAPDGSIWVVDSGTGGDQEITMNSLETGEPVTAFVGNTARIVQVMADGSSKDVAMLPSVLNGQEATGGGRLALIDGTLYVTSGVWLEGIAPERMPMQAAVLKLDNGALSEVGNTWDIEVATNPDGFIKEAHPYDLAADSEGMLWIAESGANTLLKLNPMTGEVSLVATFAGIASPIPNPNRGGAMESDPVPTGVVVMEDGTAYVSMLPGFPFIPGSAKVVMVSPDGTVTDYATGLTMVTDLAQGPDGNLYVVQLGVFTEQGPTPNSGAILRIKDGVAEEVLNGLSFPTSVAFNEAGDAFVTINGVGAPGSGEVHQFAGIAHGM